MDFSTLSPPYIFAHRGYSDRYPENTMVAFQAAIRWGARLVELDVRLSKDGKVVVIHDASVERTTDGHGPVGDHTLEELKQLDAGSWFDSRFSGERIPTLEEVLRQIAGRGCINIEIKTSLANGAYTGALERAVIETVRRTNAGEMVLVSSFDVTVLRNIRAIDHKVRVALIANAFEADDIISNCIRLRAYSFHPNLDDAERKKIERIKAAGVFVFPFNIQTPSDMQKAIRLGVDGYFVNDPELAQQHLNDS
jgi:glycerophosphoryl diester phosphodiesterase